MSEAWASKHDQGRSYRATPAWSGELDGGEPPTGVLDDFGLFRETYLSHSAKAWMSEAADTVARLMATPSPEFLVMNCPPSVGKSTFMQDLFAWLIARNRRVRTAYGAATKDNAADATALIKSYLESDQPPRADPRRVAAGEAVQSRRTLAADFGSFKPDSERGGLWRSDAFRVDYADEGSQSNKEPTCRAFGRETGILGHRFDLIAWDDLVTEENTRSLKQNEDLKRDWDGGLGESRIEPDDTSLLFLVGQRIGPRDLYRYNIDKAVTEFVDGREVDRKKYTEIRFPAHYDEFCTGAHERGVARSWPHGCLLDAARLPWYGPGGLKDKRDNSPLVYAVQYQQQDGNAEDCLIHHSWVFGGTDADGVERPGCINKTRSLGQLPANLSSNLVSMVTVDPSPSQYWAVQWWIIDRANDSRILMSLEDKRMRADGLLDYLIDERKYVGMVEDLYWKAKSLGVPLSHVVFEINVSQKFVQQNDAWRKWRQTRNVALISHTTTRTKHDPDVGLAIMKEPYRSGHVDLPFADVASRVATENLARQLSQSFERDDQMMANWFMELQYSKLSAPKRLPLLPRASWQRRRSA